MKKYTGIFLIVGFLILHLALINDYGLTWDFHFHFFGGGKLLGYEPLQMEPRPLPYVEPDPRNAWTLPYGPLMSIPPVASYLLLRNILPADSAYHLPIILWGIAGIGILYFFLKEAVSARVALFAALFLALTPRYFGDMHNNMKDIPSAVIFALNMWFLWRGNIWLAIAAFAVAFNVKINSIFIPVIFFLWKPSKRYLWYFIAAPIAAFLLWSLFWQHPVAQLNHAYRTFAVGTNNIEVLLNGSWYCSGKNVPWYYPFWYLGITTPLPILGFFILGLFTKSPIKKLLLLWLCIPLVRYLFPSVGVIDGIRHFEEVLPAIAAIAALGANHLFSFKRPGLSKLILLIVYWLLVIINVSYHPYQITYFNELVGGTKGAFGKYDLDYWGTSQKAAVAWVNTHAPQHATVHIAMAADVAGTYLRPDLLPTLNKFGYDQSDFVVILNRQSFIYRFFYVYEYLLRHTPTHTISVAGAPLTWIFDNRTENKTARQTPWWQGQDPCILQYWKGNR